MFVTLEGPEGAGKTTVLARLAARLEEQGHDVFMTREPGEGELGAAVRQALLHGGALEPLTELFLFLADRAEHVAKAIRPALARGEVVLCDRFSDSTVVYQGYARGLNVDQVRELNTLATGGLKPDLTLLLDVDASVGTTRAGGKDRLDKEPLEFHEKVRAGFLTEAKREEGRWRIVDASKGLDDVVQVCWELVSTHPTLTGSPPIR